MTWIHPEDLDPLEPGPADYALAIGMVLLVVAWLWMRG